MSELDNLLERTDYTADNITVLEGLEAVRLRQLCILVILGTEVCITWFMKLLTTHRRVIGRTL